MARNAEFYKHWLEHDGKTVTIDGIKHVLRVNCYEVIYPYRHQVISVYAEVKNKNTKYYRDLRREYGDDWSTDVLESDELLTNQILQQLEA